MDARKSFWVLYDTATRPEYYGDVHKILALPPGALIEYQYRSVRITDDALNVASGPFGLMPKRILVVYGQSRQFKRGGGDQEPPTPHEEMLWQGLRYGELVAKWTRGEHHHFQFRVEAYPSADPIALEPIIRELASRLATPYDHWVALSDQAEALSSLVAGEDDDAWQAIVDRLAAPPMQFAGDSFWRVERPERNGPLRTGALLRSKYVDRPGAEPAIDHFYVIPEHSEFAVSVNTHEPVAAVPPIEDPELALTVPGDGPLHEPHPSTIKLRRNSTMAVAVESKHSAKAERRRGTLEMSSADSVSWGNPVRLEFLVRLARWKRTLGLMLVFSGAVMGVVAAAVRTAENPPPVVVSIALGVGALVAGGAGQRFFAGAWSFKT